MKALVVLDYFTTSVLFIRITDEMNERLEDEFENDTEEWISALGLEKKFGFSISNANWMIADDFPELFMCNIDNGEMTQVFPFV